MTGPATPRRSLFNYLGIAILLVGMATGDFLYWRSLRSAPRLSDEELLVTAATSRAYERDMQRYVGTFGVIMAQCSDAVAKLAEPRPLAIAVMAVSVLAGGGCFLLASRLPPD